MAFALRIVASGTGVPPEGRRGVSIVVERIARIECRSGGEVPVDRGATEAVAPVVDPVRVGDVFTPPGDESHPSPVSLHLARTARTLARHWPEMAALVVLSASLEWVFALATGGDRNARILAASLARPVTTAAMLHLVHAEDEGDPITPWAALARGAVSFPSIFASRCVYSLVLALGLVCGLLPGLYAAVRWGLSWPVLVLERRGLGRAAELSAGRRGEIAMVLAITWAPVVPCALAGGWLAARLPGPDLAACAADGAATLASLLPTLAMYEFWRSIPAPHGTTAGAPRFR
jgi:hypothetical protein